MIRNAAALVLMAALPWTAHAETQAAPTAFATADAAFLAGVQACEALYARQTGGPDPFADRGLFLAPGGPDTVYHAEMTPQAAGGVLARIDGSPGECRVKAFDAPGSQAAVLAWIQSAESGWRADAEPTGESGVEARAFSKTVGPVAVRLALSWPKAGQKAAQGVAATAVLSTASQAR